jgi:hypothetical protein
MANAAGARVIWRRLHGACEEPVTAPTACYREHQSRPDSALGAEFPGLEARPERAGRRDRQRG